MYILDEIDAALDLSHTQHIGQLFKSRFKGSQFIVVSLKEGLFTNANVLFRCVGVHVFDPHTDLNFACQDEIPGWNERGREDSPTEHE